jgi:alpha-glucosidase
MSDQSGKEALRDMSTDRSDWWRGAVLYQIYPLSFADSNGDGWGDLPGIIDKLDYIAALGVDGIWLSPFYCSAWTDYGYDTIDQKNVDPRCGSLADFDRLLARAHALGLKVLVDQVYTYTSNRHPWFLSSRNGPEGPHGDWYVWSDPRPDGGVPNNWVSIFGGPAWSWDMSRRQYFMTHFLPEMPHLRVENPAVQEELLGIGRFWLDRGVDGFRLDVINLAVVDPELRNNPASGETRVILPAHAQNPLYDGNRPEALEFVNRIRSLADEREGRFLLGEIAGRAPMTMAQAYTEGKTGLHSAYFVLGGDQALLTASQLRRELQAWSDDAQGWPTWSFSNHDIVRGPTRCGHKEPSAAFAELLMAIVLAARGTALIYQGDELGLPDAQLPYEALRDPASRRFYPEHLQRDGARTPMPWDNSQTNSGFTSGKPWLPMPHSHNSLAAAQQDASPDSTLAVTRALIALRRAHPALQRGSVQFEDLGDDLLGFVRSDGTERIACIFNLTDQPIPSDYTTRWSHVLLERGVRRGKDGPPVLGPYGFLVAC